MPLSLARPGVASAIKKIGGRETTRAHLQNLGFVEGGTVNVVSSMNGNLIVNVKDSRVALSRELAMKIMV
jgi:ferrous iron transport protein A